MSYKIRLAKENDCEELSKLKHTIWDQTYRGIFRDELIDDFDYDKNRDKFLNCVTNPNNELFVVEDNNRLVGYMNWGVSTRPFLENKQEILLLYVLKEYQRKGIGRELFNIGYNKIKEKGYNEFIISCNKYNKNARAFYEKMGGILVHTDEDNEDKKIPQVKYLYKIEVR